MALDNHHKIARGYEQPIAPLPKLIIFDLDDTLCDHALSLRIRLDYAFSPFIVDPEERQEAVQQAIAVSHFGTDHFDDVLAAHGVHEPNMLETVIERYASDRFRGLELHDDSLWAIDVISKVAPIGLITNGPTDIQQPKIDMLDIEHHFVFVLISESVGVWKPDPRIFEIGLERAKTKPEEAIYIGDSPESDVAGAQAAGIPAIWINRAERPWPGGPPPDLEVRSLRELVLALGLGDRA